MSHNVNSGIVEAELLLADDPELRSVSSADFVGTWILAALGGEGVLVDRLGANPLGILIYDAAGNMSVQIMNRDHGRMPTKTDPDFRSAFQSYVGYFGEYRIDFEAKTVTHYVHGSLYPRDVGRTFKRLYEFSGDRLILTATGLIGGEEITADLVWKRAD